jgi:hypothetical protein
MTPLARALRQMPATAYRTGLDGKTPLAPVFFYFLFIFQPQSPGRELNPQPPVYETDALPVELPGQAGPGHSMIPIFIFIINI